MKLLERIKLQLGWCPVSKIERETLSQSPAAEEDTGDSGRIISTPQLNLKTLYSFILVELLLFASIYYYISSGFAEAAQLLAVVAVFLIFALVYDIMSMPAVAERGIVFGFRRSKLCRWEEIRQIELKRELIFLQRWVFKLQKLVLHVEKRGKVVEVSIPIYTVADVERLYTTMLKEWKNHRWPKK